MRFSICNEIFADKDFEDVCQIISKIGYEGVEIAPFTFSKDIRFFFKKERKEIAKIADSYDITICAMHWLLKSPDGLSITTPDRKVFLQTIDYLNELLKFADQIGCNTLVFGSPLQRKILPEWNYAESKARAIKLLQEVSETAKDLNDELTIAFEPLSSEWTNFGNTVEESIEIISQVNCPNVKIHLDANQLTTEKVTPELLIDKVGLERLAHIHLNEPNKLGPGMRTDSTICDKILKHLKHTGYKKWVSVETFDPSVSGTEIATESMRFIKKTLND